MKHQNAPYLSAVNVQKLKLRKDIHPTSPTVSWKLKVHSSSTARNFFYIYHYTFLFHAAFAIA